MSYVKYREDDEKIIEHRRFLKHGSSLFSKTRGPVCYCECKYCHSIFTDRRDLYIHIKSTHNIVRPLVVINGKIAADKYMINYIDSAYIDLFGYCDEITISGLSISYSPEDDIIDITKYLKQTLSSKKVCTISFQAVTVEIELATIGVDDIHLIDNAISQWEKEVITGVRLTTNLMDQADAGNRVFLQGIYNYYLACRAQRDKSKRYDDAWTLLSRFNDIFGVGKCILKVIAYRRNWVAYLNLLAVEGEDDFSVANDYYQRKVSSTPHIGSAKQLYVEDSTKMSLELVQMFQLGKYKEVKEKLATLPDFDLLDDLNLADQLNLLSARLAVVDKNQSKAVYYYEKVITPAFQEEYSLYKKGLVHFG